VTLYELVGDEPHWFFTMELVDGVPLPTYLQAAGSALARLERLRTALGQLAAGLHFLHRAGKLHRDVKPSNVLVTRAGRVVLLDFGLAADLDHTHKHRSLQLLGTVAYMAPEQAACLPVSPAADWYSVGVMLYEALTGQLPFDGPMMDVLGAKQHQTPPPPSTRAQGVPEDLGALCMELLRRQPEERPGGEEVLRRLGGGAGSGVAGVPVVPGFDGPLVGRQAHLQRLQEAFAQLRQGRPVAVFVQGRSGAGKSALLQLFLAELARQGEGVVLAGRCYEQESVPYKALDGVVDALSRHLTELPRTQAEALLPRDLAALTRVFPVLRRLAEVTGAARRGPEATDPQELRRRGRAALRELLARLGDRRPLVIAIDDLQWGDTDSAALLAELLRPPDPPALLLVGCYRSEDAAVSPCLQALLPALPADGLLRHDLAVEPLSAQERRQLARALLSPCDRAAEARADALAEQSGGYPFFLHELVQHLRGGLAMPGAAGSPSLQEVLSARVGQLQEPARRLLEVVAVAGRPLGQADACAAAELAGQDSEALQCLRAGRLIRTAGPADSPEVETYHDRIREVVVANLDAAHRQAHHRRLAEVLAAGGRADPEVLAVHLHGAGEPARAAKYYVQAAAQAAEALAFERAAALYQRALELRPAGAPAQRDLRVRRADALANAGRGAAAARAYLEAAEGAEPLERLELQRRAALQFLSSGHVDDGLHTLRTVLGAAGLTMTASPALALGRLLWQRLRLRLRGLRYRPRTLAEVPPEELRRLDACTTAGIGLSMVDTVQGAYFQARSLMLALRAGEPQRLARALAMEAAHESIGGSRSRKRTARLLVLAEAAAEQAGGIYPRAVVELARGIVAALAGEWPTAVAGCGRAETLLRESCLGVGWDLGTAYRFSGWPLMFMGELAELARRLPVLLREAQERDDLYTVTNLTLAVGTFLRLAHDEPARARAELAGVMERWSRQGFHVQHMNRIHDEAQIDLYMGDSLSAWKRLSENWPAVRRAHLLRVQQVRVFLTHLRGRCALALAGAGHSVVEMLRWADSDARALSREGVPWAAALAVLLDAGVWWGQGDGERAAGLFAEAAERLEAVAMRLYAAAARRRRGELVGGPAGQKLMADADAWMTGQGVRCVERMTALLAPGFSPQASLRT
jgi:hypothetical protein